MGGARTHWCGVSRSGSNARERSEQTYGYHVPTLPVHSTQYRYYSMLRVACSYYGERGVVIMIRMVHTFGVVHTCWDGSSYGNQPYVVVFYGFRDFLRCFFSGVHALSVCSQVKQTWKKP